MTTRFSCFLIAFMMWRIPTPIQLCRKSFFSLDLCEVFLSLLLFCLVLFLVIPEICQVICRCAISVN